MGSIWVELLVEVHRDMSGGCVNIFWIVFWMDMSLQLPDIWAILLRHHERFNDWLKYVLTVYFNDLSFSNSIDRNGVNDVSNENRGSWCEIKTMWPAAWAADWAGSGLFGWTYGSELTLRLSSGYEGAEELGVSIFPMYSLLNGELRSYLKFPNHLIGGWSSKLGC